MMSKSKDKHSSDSDVTKKDKLRQTTMGQYMDVESSHSSKSDRSAEKRSRFRYRTSFFRKWSDKDTEQYRLGYPGKKDNPKYKENLTFYKNEMKSHPDGDYIDNIHQKWWGDYHLLEQHHGYIQWLFPIRESGMNFYSQELQVHEAQAIMADPKAHRRVLKSYEMMLDFYGMELDKKTGEIHRASNWKSRFRHLNSSYHNYLRITRILKCLGEFDYEHLKKPFIEFVLEEALEKGTLENTIESCCNYWVGTIKNDDDRKFLLTYVQKMEEGYGTKNPPKEFKIRHNREYSSDEEETDMSKYFKDDPDVSNKENDEMSTNTGSESTTESMDSQEMQMWKNAEESFGLDLLNEATNGKSKKILHPDIEGMDTADSPSEKDENIPAAEETVKESDSNLEIV